VTTFDTPDAPGRSETSDIDGHTLDELSDYLDAGRMPADPTIDHSPACQLALEALGGVRAASLSMMEREAEDFAVIDESWIDAIIGAISLDVHAGRDIPLASAPSMQLSVTEGAVKGLVRAAGDRVPGLLVGRCLLHGDVTTAGSEITLSIDTIAYWGESIPDAVTRLRDDVSALIAEHTELSISAIDITVRDIHLDPAAADGVGKDKQP
jgi:uncharacterized alkaline shock family protein YloU